MNKIYLGDTQTELPDSGFIYITDEVPKPSMSRREVVFDPLIHTFSALHNLTYETARPLADVLYTAYPQGQNTLTVRNGRIDLLPALIAAKNKPFNQIKGSEEVNRLVGDIMASPLLHRVLCTNKNHVTFTPGMKVLVRLNRAEVPDFDAQILAFLLIAQAKRYVVLDDLDFYGRDAHTYLFREQRIRSHVDSYTDLKDREKLHRAVLKVKDTQYSNVLYEDAVELAKRHCHFLPGTDGYSTFIQTATGLIATPA